MKNSTLITIGLVLVLAWVLVNSFFIVDQRQRAVMFRFGELTEANFAPGLHLTLPIVQTVRSFDGRVLKPDNQTETFPTVEKTTVAVDYNSKCRIDESAPNLLPPTHHTKVEIAT